MVHIVFMPAGLKEKVELHSGFSKLSKIPISSRNNEDFFVHAVHLFLYVSSGKP